jgi:hypothetical protein
LSHSTSPFYFGFFVIILLALIPVQGDTLWYLYMCLQYISDSAPPCVGYFWDRVFRTICLSWPQAVILLISASWVARIIGMRTSAQQMYYKVVCFFVLVGLGFELSVSHLQSSRCTSWATLLVLPSFKVYKYVSEIKSENLKT